MNPWLRLSLPSLEESNGRQVCKYHDSSGPSRADILPHQELRGSFLRLRAAVADLTYSASYSSGVGSRYGAAPTAPLPYDVDDE